MKAIEIDPLNAGLSSTLDFDGFYSHDLDGIYNNYCGPLDFSLIPDPCDALCLTGTVLTLDSPSSHVGGIFGHSLKIFLRDYPTVELDLPISVEIIPCTITGHYANFINNIAVSPS